MTNAPLIAAVRGVGPRQIGPCGECACFLSDGRCHRFPPAYSGWGSAWAKVEKNDPGCYEFREAAG